jgi:hypothetical protein
VASEGHAQSVLSPRGLGLQNLEITNYYDMNIIAQLGETQYNMHDEEMHDMPGMMRGSPG